MGDNNSFARKFVDGAAAVLGDKEHYARPDPVADFSSAAYHLAHAYCDTRDKTGSPQAAQASLRKIWAEFPESETIFRTLECYQSRNLPASLHTVLYYAAHLANSSDDLEHPARLAKVLVQEPVVRLGERYERESAGEPYCEGSTFGKVVEIAARTLDEQILVRTVALFDQYPKELSDLLVRSYWCLMPEGKRGTKETIEKTIEVADRLLQILELPEIDSLITQNPKYAEEIFVDVSALGYMTRYWDGAQQKVVSDLPLLKAAAHMLSQSGDQEKARREEIRRKTHDVNRIDEARATIRALIDSYS
ncbi:hypothetical protein HYS49_00120 [Candidatus Woesearchaeota archaeon]|nr:hypothetical protein [Candidatus Woesearchaeota archaeon]